MFLNFVPKYQAQSRLHISMNLSNFVQVQAAADRAYVDKKKWSEMSILCTAGSARFSSDRTIEDYAKKT